MAGRLATGTYTVAVPRTFLLLVMTVEALELYRTLTMETPMLFAWRLEQFNRGTLMSAISLARRLTRRFCGLSSMANRNSG